MGGNGNGGAEVYSTDVMLSLHAAGIDQCVVMRDTAPRTTELRQAGLRMATEVLNIPFRPWQRFQVGRLIAREKPDIIHCWMRRAASLTPKNAQSRAAVIGWYGDYEEIDHFAHCSHFVGVTKDIVSFMLKSGVAADRATYVPTFPSIIDAPALDRAALTTPADAKVLLTLSRLHPVKGLDTMLQALKDLPDCYLWLAGDGPSREELMTLAVDLGVHERVRFLGWRTDRGALLRAADICVLPSRYEPFGTVILEAWQLKIPFVACASDGPRAHIRDGKNGMLVAINDAVGLAGAIRRVIDDKKLRDAIVAEGHGEYQAGFTREAVTKQWIDYYQGLVP